MLGERGRQPEPHRVVEGPPPHGFTPTPFPVGGAHTPHISGISPRPLPITKSRSRSGACPRGHHSPAPGALISPHPRKFPFAHTSAPPAASPCHLFPLLPGPPVSVGTTACGRGPPGPRLSQGLELGTRRWSDRSSPAPPLGHTPLCPHHAPTPVPGPDPTHTQATTGRCGASRKSRPFLSLSFPRGAVPLDLAE